MSADAASISVSFRDQPQFQPGQACDLDIAWQLPQPPDRIEWRLVWETSGRGDTDVGIGLADFREDVDATGEHAVRLTMPSGPYSCDGNLVSITWVVEVFAFPGNQTASAEFVLGPGGKTMRLPPIIPSKTSLLKKSREETFDSE